MRALHFVRPAILAALCVSFLALPAGAGATFKAKNSGQIVFGASGPGEAGQLRIGGMNGGSRALTRSPQFSFASTPSFSPNRKLIAFTGSGPSAQPQVWVIRPDGSGLRQVTTAGGFQPSFSANGRFLLYSNNTTVNGRADIWRIPVGGGSPHRLVTGIHSIGNFGAVASPNGRIFAFESGNRIFTARIDGTRVKQLAGGTQPDFSPNGQWVLYVSGGSANRRLLMRVPSGGRTRRIYDPAGNFDLNYPSFSPNGRFVIVQNSSRARNVIRVDVRTHNHRRLLSRDAEDFFYDSPVWRPR